MLLAYLADFGRKFMPQTPKDVVKKMYDALRIALSNWNKQNAAAETLLPELLSVQYAREQLNAGDNPAMLRAATNQVLADAIADLEKQEPKMALVLRLRFIEKTAIKKVGIKLHFSPFQISRIQQNAIEQMVEIVKGREQDIKRERAEYLEGLLPPPTYTRLFGVDDVCRSLVEQLKQPNAPWVVALVGMGGLGKTALANHIARKLIQQLSFTHVVWINTDPPHSISGLAEPPSLTYEKIINDVLGQIFPETQLPFALAEREVKVRQALKRQMYLVVIDNLEAAKDTSFLLNHLNELANPSKFILTTRTRAAKQAAVLDVLLDVLGFDDSAALMRHQAEETGITAVSEASDEDLREIYNLIGGNPFALKIVVNLLDMLPLDRLLDGLTHNHPDGVMGMYKHIFWQTWRTLSENGRKLLQAMPLTLEPAEIDYLLSISGLSENALWPAIEELRQRSLLEIQGGLHEKRYGIHRLTDTFLRTEIIHSPI
jgi:NB-ARC domain